MTSPTHSEDMLSPPLFSRLPPAIRDASAPRDSIARLIAFTAALAITVSSAALFHRDTPEAKYYVTRIGDQKSIGLKDGSVITLNTDSSIKIDSDGPTLSVQIFHGEVHFNMLPNPHRHLVVSVGDEFQVFDIATIFDIRVTDEGKARVTVQEGSVQLSVAHLTEVQLSANQQAVVRSDASNISIHTRNLKAKDIERQFAWLRNQLDFECTTLADAARDFNRYNIDRLEIMDERAGNIQVGGAYWTTDPIQFAKAVAELSKNIRLSSVTGPADTRILQLSTRDTKIPPKQGCTPEPPLD